MAMKELLFILIAAIIIAALIKLPDLYPLESRGIAYRISQEEIYAEMETFPARLVVFERLYLDKLLLNGSRNLTVDLDEFASEIRTDLKRKGMEAGIKYHLEIGPCDRVNDSLNNVFDGSSDPRSIGVRTKVYLEVSSEMTHISGKRSYVICVCHPYRKICFDRVVGLLPRNSSFEESGEFNSTDEIERWVKNMAKQYRNKLVEIMDKARATAGNCSLDLTYNIDEICNKVYSHVYILIYKINVTIKQEDITLYHYGGSKRGISEKFTTTWWIYLNGELSKRSENTNSTGINVTESELSAPMRPG
ncbi:MAG: hypothetical protein ACP5JF_03330 [Candidatus Methanodesulfokora sp.]|jgi:hypothetical protein